MEGIGAGESISNSGLPFSNRNSAQNGGNVSNKRASPVPKPLKSILKRRKPENETTESVIVAEPSDDAPAIIDKPKGGSITAALKMITGIARGSDDEDDDADPKPSAFILEMEKQKDKLPIVVPGAFSFPHRLEGIDVADMDWQSTSSPQEAETNSFFKQEQLRLKEKKAQRDKQKEQIPKRTKTKITKGPLTMLTPHEDIIECIVLINNLPFKVTAEEMVKILGIWPKGGYDGVKIVTDRWSLPTGYAYVIVERHSDMMDVLRLSGLEVEGRKIKCCVSTREDLIKEWKITKKALAERDKSRVVKVAQLPFTLKKSELVKALGQVKFAEDDIYWSPLRSGQTNSGRGFIVLQRSEDAKTLAAIKEMRTGGRMIELSQVHPSELEKFCNQCKLEIVHKEKLIDPMQENFDDVSDLNLDYDRPKEASMTETSYSQAANTNFVVTDEVVKKDSSSLQLVEKDGGKDRKKRGTRRRSRERDHPNGPMPLPPFQPTPFVRMYNVPDKANFDDVRSFFDPILPARINKNPGHNIYDVEFYNPDEALRSMVKHTLLMRKNVISLEMLPGPPNPLPPGPFPMPTNFMPSHVGPGQFGPQMVPPGPFPPGLGMAPLGMGPLGIMPGPAGPLPMPGPGSTIPGPGGPMPGPGAPMLGPGGLMVGHGGPMQVPAGPMPIMGPSGSMFIPDVPMMMKPGLHNADPRNNIDPKHMPPPMHGHENSEESGKSKRTRRKSPSPERTIKPKKELIPVPPLPEDFAKYRVPAFKEGTPVGQGVITTMQGYFCQLCNKFYSSRTSAKDAHCKTKAHYDKLKQFLQEKKRLRRLAESEVRKR